MVLLEPHIVNIKEGSLSPDIWQNITCDYGFHCLWHHPGRCIVGAFFLRIDENLAEVDAIFVFGWWVGWE